MGEIDLHKDSWTKISFYNSFSPSWWEKAYKLTTVMCLSSRYHEISQLY